MTKTMIIPDVAQYESTDSELAKYTIQKLSIDNKTILKTYDALEDEYKMLTKKLTEEHNALLKTKKEIKELRHWVVNNKHNENTKEHYLVVDYGLLMNKLNSLQILRGNNENG